MFVLNLVIVVILDAAMAIIEADTPIIPDVQNLGDIDDDDEARFLNSDEQAEEVSARKRKWPPAPSPAAAPSRRKACGG